MLPCIVSLLNNKSAHLTTIMKRQQRQAGTAHENANNSENLLQLMLLWMKV